MGIKHSSNLVSRRVSFIVLLVLTCTLLVGCDSFDAASDVEGASYSSLFAGRMHTVEQGASLVQNAQGQLRVTGTHQKGLSVDTHGDSRVDLVYRPVDIEVGGTFVNELLDTDTKVLARVLHRGIRPGHARTMKQLEVDLSGLQVQAFTAAFYNRGQFLMEEEYKLEGTAPVVLGNTEQGPTSFHYIEEDGVIRIIVDYEEDAMTDSLYVFPNRGEGQATAVYCSHIVLTPQTVPTQRLVMPRIGGVALRGIRTGDFEFLKERFVK